MRFSSSFKVGLLTLVSLFILLFTVLWVKGRSFSSGERIDIIFKDVNGMRPGSGVQMMGLRVGQVEEIIPVINGEDSYVKLRFVITEPGLKIPKASVFSIQQSGLIGEQFLEITPPRIRTTYIEASGNILFKDDVVKMKLDKKMYDVGKIKGVQILSAQLVPPILRPTINTKYAYKVDYIIDMPGLIAPSVLKGNIVSRKNGVKELCLSTLDNTVLPLPKQTSPYTVINPMRISDFLDLQYKAAESLTETTLKVNELLSDEVIVDLKQSIENVNVLTAKASTTLGKAEKLLDSSAADIDRILKMADSITNDFNKVANDVNNIIGDPVFKPKFIDSMDSVSRLSRNLSVVLEASDAKTMSADLQQVMRNLNDISTYVNTMTKDEKLKDRITKTIIDIDTAMGNISSALEMFNKMTPSQKSQVQTMMEDAEVTTKNLRKFSEKLNKKFLLFRLMF